MPIRVLLKSLTFSDGTTVDTSGSKIVVLVGPNNSGKSSTLNEILVGAGASAHEEIGPVLRQVLFDKHGSSAELKEWLNEKVQKVLLPYNRGEQYSWLGSGCAMADVEKSWTGQNLGELNAILCTLISVDKRIGVANPQEPINFFEEAPSHPVHVLFKNPDLENKVNEAFKAAFKTEIVLNRGGGKFLAFHFGAKPELRPNENILSHSYFTRLCNLPFLHKQGHGMRSFAGCIFHAFTSPAFIHLLDEPEAFLHPPHAKLLGSLLARSIGEDRQVIIATHSGDFLRGLLDATPTGLRVIRLTRDGQMNHVHELNADSIRVLWADPVLRFSNVLDAVFHDGVVLCESDSDCRFYSAVLNAVLENRGAVAPDVMFAASGGKDRMPVIVQSLRRLGVKMRVIADFDVLRDEGTLSGIVNSLGGDWGQVKTAWQNVTASIRTQSPPLALNQVREQISVALDGEKNSSVSERTIEKIKGTLKATSPWHGVKLAGVSAFPSGQQRIQLNEFLGHLKGWGLFPVDCGEIERFVPTVGDHGPKWVSQVLTKNLSNDPELEMARKFIAEVFDVGPHVGWSQPDHVPKAPVQSSVSTNATVASESSTAPRPIWNALLKRFGF
jgi:predicted ATPase